MKFTIQREALLKPLQSALGAVEKRHTLAILANVLLKVTSHQLSVLATDLEIEIKGGAVFSEPAESGAITAPAHKLIDICKSLPDESMIDFTLKDDKLMIKSGRSRFVLAALPADEFPCLEESVSQVEFNINQKQLLQLLQKTQFSMAQQDVRYFLNGLLLHQKGSQLIAVATDGHRLAFSECENKGASDFKVIIPRKAIAEMVRLLGNEDKNVTMHVTENHFRIVGDEISLTSKQIEGRYPDYNDVIPKGFDKHCTIDKDVFKSALTRVAILSNDKFRGVRLMFDKGVLTVLANNPEREEAEDVLESDYNSDPVELSVNVSYVIDVLSALPIGQVKLSLMNSDSCLLIESPDDKESLYVIMPMWL